VKGTVFGSGTANFDNFPKNANSPIDPMFWISDGNNGRSDHWEFPFG